ncbi:MAG: MlaD family protein [Bacteroidetes bacterium]|nr:MlaD family protein [Bacteroidota bacterium]
MRDQRKVEIKVGITVIVALLIFLWILGWAKNFSFTAKDNFIKVRFNNVAGLEVGDYVTVNGVKKGNVQDIKIESNDVMVTLSVNKDVDLKSDAIFGISMIDLMGGKKIDIKPGSSSDPIDYNKIQNGIFYSDIPEVMSFVGSMENDLVVTLKNVNVTLNSVNKYLTDQKLNENIKSSLSNLSQLTEKLNLMIDENRINLKKLTENSVDITNQAKDFIAQNKNNISASISEADGILKKTDTLVTKLNDFTNDVKSRNNNLGKIMYDDKLYDNLTQSIKQVNELTKILIEQLQNKGFKVDAKIHLF